MGSSFRVIALISAYNEGDIISQVIQHLVENGVEAYLIDHHSTDDTVARASLWFGRGLLKIEKFPEESGFPAELANVLRWRAILKRKQQLAQQLGADWYIHHDADEMREAPFPGMSLRDALRWVCELGYNCVDSELYNFWPTDDTWEPGQSDPKKHFQYFEPAADYDRLQRKSWRAQPQEVDLVTSGGHDVSFPDRRVFPIPFLLRHYRIRSQAHGLRKVSHERISRFDPEERVFGWHIQYDTMLHEKSFIHDPEKLRRFDVGAERLRLMVENREARALREQLRALEEVRPSLESVLPSSAPVFQPIFIMGMSRKSASAVAHALRAAGIVGFGEGHLAPLMDKMLADVDAHFREHHDLAANPSHLIGRLSDTDLEKHIGTMMRDLYRELHGADVFFEKTVDVTMVRAAPRIAGIWPSSRFIMITRSGIESVQAEMAHFPTLSFEHHCGAWNASMSEWLKVRNSVQALEIDSAEISDRPDLVAQRLVAFLGLGQEREIGARQALTESQLSGPRADRNSAAAEHADRGWSQEEVAYFWKVCGTTMKAYRYAEEKEKA